MCMNWGEMPYWYAVNKELCVCTSYDGGRSASDGHSEERVCARDVVMKVWCAVCAEVVPQALSENFEASMVEDKRDQSVSKEGGNSDSEAKDAGIVESDAQTKQEMQIESGCVSSRALKSFLRLEFVRSALSASHCNSSCSPAGTLYALSQVPRAKVVRIEFVV